MAEELFETFGAGNFPKLREIISSLSWKNKKKF